MSYLCIPYDTFMDIIKHMVVNYTNYSIQRKWTEIASWIYYGKKHVLLKCMPNQISKYIICFITECTWHLAPNEYESVKIINRTIG